MKKIIILGVFALTVLTFGACTKAKDGAPGAQGPKGNANVINTSITVHSSDWIWDGSQWYYNYYTTVNLQSAINGYVMSVNGQEAMPYYNQQNGTTTSFAGNLFMSPSYIRFEYYGSATLARPTSDTYLYLVCIPPAIIAQHPNVDFKNYAQVKQAFNLPN